MPFNFCRFFWEFDCVRFVLLWLTSSHLRLHVGVSRNASRVNTFLTFIGVLVEARVCVCVLVWNCYNILSRIHIEPNIEQKNKKNQSSFQQL